MSRPLALLFAFFLIAADDTGPLPHASGTPAGPGRNCGGAYTVARGDTLYSIARRCETSVAWLVRVNELGDPPQLEPGQELEIGIEVENRAGRSLSIHSSPPPPPPTTAIRPLPRMTPARTSRADAPRLRPRAEDDIYRFQAGDTLYSLARWARTSLAALRAANPDIDPRDIEIGDPIRLPRGAARPEPMRLRERGRPAPTAAASPAPPPPTARPPRPPAVRPAPPPGADKPADDEDRETPGGMDDGGPEPDGM